MRKVIKKIGDIGTTYGERILYLREKKGISQDELGEKLKQSRETISYYESNKRIPKIDDLKQIVKIFNTTSDFILCISNTETPDNLEIGKSLGLSDKSINKLHNFINNQNFNGNIGLSAINMQLLYNYSDSYLLNKIIEDDNLVSVFQYLRNALAIKEMHNNILDGYTITNDSIDNIFLPPSKAKEYLVLQAKEYILKIINNLVESEEFKNGNSKTGKK